ncbi:peptide deformylase [Streptomyces sp. HNM0574]|uniref:peptide deformylase n=1 Tax=Streptomyces sp. HNM0574 TaxID=2714954 RepID=UPI00146B05C6|nr:peptide deformylase [Streptomyces sp. HNM0574]NLU69813.1 peptide deformylase [Streptomyces sp. HNM0574]
MQRGSIPGGSGSVRPLRLYGDPGLHSPSREAAEEPLAALVEDMFATMYAHHGVGLAAPQIGVPLRLFVYDCPDDEDRRHLGHVLNPRLTSTGGVTVRGPEGCLSLPGLEAATARHDLAVVEGHRVDGTPVRVEGTGYFARCLQHEVDHLDGLLYTDRTTRGRRRRVLRAARRAHWAGATELPPGAWA